MRRSSGSSSRSAVRSRAERSTIVIVDVRRLGIGLGWALVAACRFAPGTAPPDDPGDARGDGPPVTADGATEPSWAVIDTLTVPATGVMVTSAVTLERGVGYRLRASGTWIIQSVPGTQADAEWWDFNNPMDGVTGIDVGLAIDDTTVNATRTPKWGAYTPTHVYEVDWPGGGRPIVAMIHDGNYANNAGSLTLEILAPP